ncbi:hypothetical protein Tco_0516904 [Tanacetum coccineum]
MADNRTMAQMLQAPIEGYEDAIVVPTINANNFELKQTLINLVQIINLRVDKTLIIIFDFSTRLLLLFVSKTDFESYAKANDANMNNLQMKLDNFQRNQNDFQRVYNDSQKKQDDFQNMMLSFMQNYHSNTTSSSGTLLSQTVTNPREHVNAITTRSGKTCEGPSTPLVPTHVVSTPQEEPKQNPETSTNKVQKSSLESTAQVPPPEEEESIFIEIPKPKAKKTVNIEIQEPNSPKPTSYQPKLPYPERMKVRENDKPSAQHSRFLKMFKQLRLEIGLKDALVEMPKFNKMVKDRC